MDAEARPFDPLLRQWGEFPVGDRKAILKRLDLGQRLAFQRLLAEAERADAELAACAKRFSACSPWLSELLNACEKSLPTAAAVKPQVRAALLAAHDAASQGKQEPDEPPSLADFVLSFVRSLRERL